MSNQAMSDIRFLSSLCGKLYCISYMEGATITKALAIELECAAERLECYIGGVTEKEVDSDEEGMQAFEGVIP